MHYKVLEICDNDKILWNDFYDIKLKDNPSIKELLYSIKIYKDIIKDNKYDNLKYILKMNTDKTCNDITGTDSLLLYNTIKVYNEICKLLKCRYMKMFIYTLNALICNNDIDVLYIREKKILTYRIYVKYHKYGTMSILNNYNLMKNSDNPFPIHYIMLVNNLNLETIKDTEHLFKENKYYRNPYKLYNIIMNGELEGGIVKII